MRKGSCAKCGKYTYVDAHHILPKNIFAEQGDKIDLCPNCHREYHDKLGSKNLKNKDMEFHLYFFYRWLSGLVFVLGLIALGILMFL